MYIETCSLGCTNGQGGLQVSCGIVNVGRNVEITVLFSDSVDLASVNSGTFRIINTSNGSVPVGTYSLDPVNDRRLIFRPGLTFDSIGNPIYALSDNQTYQVTIPGQAQGDTGALIRSLSGKVNQTRLQCTIRTSEGVLDPVPGPPRQNTTIEVREVPTNDVLQVFDPANGATGVPTSGPASGQRSIIKVVFDDVMNPATLANLSTGQSSTITVKIDPDGDITNSSDQVDQAGFFTVLVDFDNLRTTLEFTPSGGFPSGGRDDDPTVPGNQEVKRVIVMTLPASLLDLVGNQLANPGLIIFRPELIEFDPILLPPIDPTIPGDTPGEGFQNQANEDVLRSGGTWGNGRLTFGRGGGSGRLGELLVAAGEEFVLNTNSMVFPYPTQVRSNLDNTTPGVDYDPLDPSTWPVITVTGGAFEFSRVLVSAGGRLKLTGSQVGRLFARGVLQVSNGAVIDVSGTSALPHRGNSGRNDAQGALTRLGGAGGAAGVGGGVGGAGGNRIDHTENAGQGCQTTTMLNVGGILFPEPPNNPGVDNDGRTGVGLGGSGPGGGVGGIHWPSMTPKVIQTNPSACLGNFEVARLQNPSNGTFQCRVPMVAGPGGGGAYALSGGLGIPISPYEGSPSNPGVLPFTPGPTAGGDATLLGIEGPDQPAFVRRLDFHQGNLRGGSGGGGGGVSVYASQTNTSNSPCIGTAGITIFPFFDHSGAGGGGGGGAIQLTAGKRITLNGAVNAAGGGGGSALSQASSIFSCTNVTATPDCNDFAAPGGGGSGGAVRLQSVEIGIPLLPGRVDIQGGVGGIGAGGSTGGTGSPGLVRLELPTVNPNDPGQIQQLAAQYAPSIAPYLPGASTDPGGFNYPFTSGAILSIGDWEFQRRRPDSMSASMSCWMKPEGNFFELQFIADDDTNPDDPAAKGWNMEILYATPAGEKAFPYRGLSSDPAFPLTGMDFQEYLGNFINSEFAPGVGSILAVRFQGARATGSLGNPCDVVLTGVGTEIEPGSLTPWVQHPAELNQFLPQPNMIRFCVVFEEALKSQGPVQFRVRGVTNLVIGVQPN